MVSADLTSPPRARGHARPIGAVVVGASAGGIVALGALLPALRSGSKVPVVVVVHLPPNIPSLLVELFQRQCALPVREAEDKQPVGAGVWFAPPGYHLLIERERTFALSVDQPVHYSRPSIDVLFESAADAYGAALGCVLLTGASSDGALGAKRIRERGGFVMVQDPATADSSTMPRAAIEMASPQWVGSLQDMAVLLAEMCDDGGRG